MRSRVPTELSDDADAAIRHPSPSAPSPPMATGENATEKICPHTKHTHRYREGEREREREREGERGREREERERES